MSAEVVGSAAEWVSAIATVGALGAAVAAGRTAKSLYDIERKRDLEQSEAAARADAAQVHAWTASWYDERDSRTDGLVITNGSNRPVFGMRVESQGYRQERKAPLALTIVPPGEYFVKETGDNYHWGFPEFVSELGGVLRPIMKNDTWRVTSLQFTDINEVRWRREDGRLVGTSRE